jgi:hypothetical protein
MIQPALETGIVEYCFNETHAMVLEIIKVVPKAVGMAK